MSNVFYLNDVPTPFTFDKTYTLSSSEELEDYAANDGIFVGRYVLVKSNDTTLDIHGTIWQKIFTNNKLQYNRIAKIDLQGVFDAIGDIKQIQEDAESISTLKGTASTNAQQTAEARSEAEDSAVKAVNAASEAATSATNASASANAAAISAANALSKEEEINQLLETKQLVIVWNDYL